LGAGSLLDGAALESLDDGVLLDGVLDVDGDVLCCIVLGSVVVAPGLVAPGLAVGLCVCSLAGAPCVGVLELSVVCA
jgi:hypothetical protein